MKYLLIALFALAGCTVQVVLPKEPISTKLDTLLSGEDPVNNTVRVSVIPEQPRKVDSYFHYHNKKWGCVVTEMDADIYVPFDWPTRQGKAICYEVMP